VYHKTDFTIADKVTHSSLLTQNRKLEKQFLVCGILLISSLKYCWWWNKERETVCL